MTNLSFRLAFLLLLGVACTNCQSDATDVSVSADLNSSNPAVVAQAQKVNSLVGQIKQQEAVIDAEKEKLKALQQQLEGAKENLKGVKRQEQATP